MSKEITVSRNDLLRLWQEIEKHHMEKMVGGRINSKDWDMFVSDLEDAYADEASELARDFWLTWALENMRDEDE